MRFTFLFGLLSILVCNLFISNHTYASTEPTIKMTKDVIGYFQLQTGEMIEYITLYEGQYYVARDKNEDHLIIQVGNAEITIPKRFTTNSGNSILPATPENQVDVITNEITQVYLKPTMESEIIATLPTDIRISTNRGVGIYYEIIVGGRKGYILRSDTQVDQGVPILIYHHLVKNQNNSIYKNNSSVYDIDLFEQQINYLNNEEFITISLADLDLWMQRKQALPGKAVILTFDDANLSVEKLVYPILRKSRMHATTFVIGNRVRYESQPFNMFTFQFAGISELRSMRDIFNFEYHTYGYHEFNSKTGRSTMQDVSAVSLKQDFERSKQLLQLVEPSINPSYFAYPYGKFNREHESILLQSGISLAFLNKGGKATIDSPRLYVPRIPVQAHMTLEQFKQVVKN